METVATAEGRPIHQRQRPKGRHRQRPCQQRLEALASGRAQAISGHRRVARIAATNHPPPWPPETGMTAAGSSRRAIAPAFSSLAVLQDRACWNWGSARRKEANLSCFT